MKRPSSPPISLQVDTTPVNAPGGNIQTHGAISASPPVSKPKPPKVK